MFGIFKRRKNMKAMEDRIKTNEEYFQKISIQTDRNIKGRELERQGKVDEAIELYEANLKDNFEGNAPYDRLAIIYRKKKLYHEEERVLKKAIEVFQKDVVDGNEDEHIKLNRFKDRLQKLNEKYLKDS